MPFKVFVEEYAKHKNSVVEHEGGLYEGPAVNYQGDIIWGASARIMENFLDILGEKICLLGG